MNGTPLSWLRENQVAEPTLRLIAPDVGNPFQALTWSDFKGQFKLKREIQMHINSAKMRNIPMCHTLLASAPGLGKTTIANIIAHELGVKITFISAQENEYDVFKKIDKCSDRDCVFIDETHNLLRRKGILEGLLPILSGWKTLSGYSVPHTTFIAATTNADKLPEAFLTRFLLQPYFEPYTIAEMRDILEGMSKRTGVSLEPKDIHYLARACSGVPRMAARLILNARVLVDNGETPTVERILNLSDMTPEGLTRLHIEYLRAIHKNPRSIRGINVYRMGFTNICTILHQPRETVTRLETLLIDKGYVTLQPGGRELTELGIKEAAK